MGGTEGRAGTRRAAAVCAAAGTVLALTACTAAPAPEATPTGPVPAPSASVAPERDPELARFTETAEAVARTSDAVRGMDFVRALERAGWARSALQVTPDRTSVGRAAPAVQFSAESDGSCLIGQYGDAGLQVLRADPVDGACLIGGTRPLG